MKIRKIQRTRRIGVKEPTPPREGRRSPTGFIGPITGGGLQTPRMDDPELQRWIGQVGEERARRCRRLAEQGVRGTLPELVAYDWLTTRNIGFDFQSSVLGGIFELGAALVDFAINLPVGYWTLLRIQGTYWHTQASVMARDEYQKGRLEKAKYRGRPVKAVVDIWEHRLYEDTGTVMQRALYGLEVPQ